MVSIKDRALLTIGSSVARLDGAGLRRQGVWEATSLP